jgi:hypothetical protein
MKALLLMTFFFGFSSYAQDVFVIKKSMNPKNILHFKANVENCKLKSPAVSSYWIMGEDNGEVEALSSKEKSYFQPKISYTNDTESDFSIGAMEKMGSKIPDQSIRIRLENCKPKAFLEISGKELALSEIFVDVNMFMSVNYMTISGMAPNGQKMSKRIAN